MPSSARAFGRHKTADEQLAARLLIRFWRDLPIYVFRCGFGPVISWLQVSVLAFVPTPEPQGRQALRSRPARAAAPASKLRKLRELPSPALGLLFSCAFCALLLGAAQAGASAGSRAGPAQDFVTDPPVPRAVLQEKQMTKVRLSQAPSRMEIAEKVRRQELEYMKSTYVPGGPKPVRIVAM